MKFKVFALGLIILYAWSVGVGQSLPTTPEGFASVNALGCNGTTGGKGGNVITITNADTLYRYLRNLRPDKNPSLPPTIFEIVGTVNRGGDKMIYLKGNANISIIGRGTNAKINGFGLKIQGASNIIIQNIEFTGSPDDAICIEEASHHVWIDHCTFSNAYDGLVDIKTQSQYVTVSWCRFYNHSKTSLFGHNDGESADTIMTATYHHCWWDGTEQRQPRVRYGRVHVYNNYYVGQKYYGIASTCEGKVYVEGNYFENVAYPMHIGYAESPLGYIVETNNIFQNCGTPVTDGREKTLGQVLSRTHNWNPASDYSYVPDAPENVPQRVMHYAGSGITSLADVENSLQRPESFAVLSNYPNPFNPSTSIQFSIPQSEQVRLAIYTLLGSKVCTLYEGKAEANQLYSFQFNALSYGSGIYLAVLQSRTFQKTLKLLYLR